MPCTLVSHQAVTGRTEEAVELSGLETVRLKGEALDRRLTPKISPGYEPDRMKTSEGPKLPENPSRSKWWANTGKMHCTEMTCPVLMQSHQDGSERTCWRERAERLMAIGLRMSQSIFPPDDPRTREKNGCTETEGKTC